MTVIFILAVQGEKKLYVQILEQIKKIFNSLKNIMLWAIKVNRIEMTID